VSVKYGRKQGAPELRQASRDAARLGVVRIADRARPVDLKVPAELLMIGRREGGAERERARWSPSIQGDDDVVSVRKRQVELIEHGLH